MQWHQDPGNYGSGCRPFCCGTNWPAVRFDACRILPFTSDSVTIIAQETEPRYRYGRDSAGREKNLFRRLFRIGCLCHAFVTRVLLKFIIGKVYADTDFDKNEWTVFGEPDTTITVNRPATVELTCATIVNRLPDLINAEPGFITTEKMDELKYRVKPLNEYVK